MASAMCHRFGPLLCGVALSLAVIALAGCSSSSPASDDTITGTISEVSGDPTAISGFVVTAADGSSHRFVPAEGLLFEGEPLSRLREYVVTGQQVIVRFERGPEGELVALSVADR